MLATLNLLSQFSNAFIEHIPRELNFAANELAKVVSGLYLVDGVQKRILKLEKRSLPPVQVLGWPREGVTTTVSKEPIDINWRILIMSYLEHPNPKNDKRVRLQALNFFLKNKELWQRVEEG